MGYSNSREMVSVLSYNDNDLTHGIVNVKPYQRCDSISPMDVKNAR